MEIRPGRGVDVVALGESRGEVRSRLGRPQETADQSDFYGGLVIRYDEAGSVELVEVTYGGSTGIEATLQGVRLTFRPINEVADDLALVGLTGRPSDIGLDFESGFAIWSMGSLAVRDIDPSASHDDDRVVVEGVSVGSPSYFGFGA